MEDLGDLRLQLGDELRRILARGDCVDGASIGRRHRVHVLGVARAPLDFEARHPGVYEPVEEGERAEVLGGEDRARLHHEGRLRLVHRLPVFVLVEVHRLHLEPPPARLSALAAARARAKGVVAHEAPARLRHALRAVDETLDLSWSLELELESGTFNC